MPYINTTQPMSGMIRMNASMNRMEVYDGQNWIQFGSDVNVDLSESVKQTLNWAREKMLEEQKIKDLMSKHPGLKEAYERLEIMKSLVLEDESK